MYLDSSIFTSFFLLRMLPIKPDLPSPFLIALMFFIEFRVKFFKKMTSFSSKSFSLNVLSLIENWPSLSRGMIEARSYTRSNVALTISSCFSLAQIQSISIISEEKYLSSMARSLIISVDLLINSTWGFSMNMKSIIFSLVIHWEYFSKLSHFVY